MTFSIRRPDGKMVASNSSELTRKVYQDIKDSLPDNTEVHELIDQRLMELELSDDDMPSDRSSITITQDGISIMGGYGTIVEQSVSNKATP